jgi:large subunit ribosomal protein L35Ae
VLVMEIMPEILYGLIIGYRTGPKTQRSKECIIKFPNAESPSEAPRLIGRKIAWPVEERKVKGKIVALHGRRGLVRARFRKGVPGQAIGTRVEVIG